MKKYIYVLLTALLLIGQSFGEMNAQKDVMKPGIPMAVKNLKKFVGNWEAKTSMFLEGKMYTVDYMVNFRETADGNGLYADEWFTDPALGTMKGTDLVGYDPYDAKIKWYFVDNMGSTNEHVGNWITPDHLYIEHNGMRKGKKYVDKIDFIFKSNDEMEFKAVGTLNGVVTQKSEGVFHKKAE